MRLATKRRARLGLSDAAYAELVEAVRKDPQGFVDDGEEEAFSLVASALDRYENDREGDDLLDDDAFAAARGRRMARMRSDCAEALSHDPGCVDALLMDAIATDAGSDALVGALMDIERRFAEKRPASRGGDPQDAWEDVFAHPYLRLAATLSRACLDSARYRMSAQVAWRLMDAAPSDVLGARHGLSLIHISEPTRH